MDESGGTSQRLPGHWFEAGVDVADDPLITLGHEDDGVVSVKLRSKEGCVAALGVIAGGQKTLRVEREMRPHG